MIMRTSLREMSLRFIQSPDFGGQTFVQYKYCTNTMSKDSISKLLKHGHVTGVGTDLIPHIIRNKMHISLVVGSLQEGRIFEKASVGQRSLERGLYQLRIHVLCEISYRGKRCPK